MKKESKNLKLYDVVYKINTYRHVLEKHKVIWIYNLEKIPQDNDNYFFDTPQQLIASELYDEEKIYKWPIEKYRFIEVWLHNHLYYTKEEAEVAFKIYKKHKDKEESKRERIRELEEKIEKIKQS